MQIGDLERAEDVLMRALEVRKPVQFHVTTGAVFDTLAQIHLMRGTYDRASEYLHQAGDAYGGYGAQTGKWYEWSVKVLEIKLAVRRRAFDEAITRANELVASPDVPPADAIQADLTACEALLELGRVAEAEQRLKTCESRFDPRTSPANWGEFLRVRGRSTGAAASRRWRIRLRAEREHLRPARRTLPDGLAHLSVPGWRPTPARAPPPSGAWRWRRRCSRCSAPAATSVT